MKAITHWQPYLFYTNKPFTILTDHTNLLHWKSPRKLNRRTALGMVNSRITTSNSNTSPENHTWQPTPYHDPQELTKAKMTTSR